VLLIEGRYVERTFKDNKIFDTQGLLAKDPSFAGRLRFWTAELCAQKPETFDIVLTVSSPKNGFIYRDVMKRF